MGALRPALRIAWRELWRRKGRTFLVVALIAVPVAAMVIGSTIARTVDRSAPVRDRGAFGAADAVTYFPYSNPEPDRDAAVARFVDRVRGALPGASFARIDTTMGDLHRPDGQPFQVMAVGGAVADPNVTGRYEVEGRMPTGPGEVALEPTVADALGTHLGQRVSIPELDLEATVVGLARTLDGHPQLFVSALPPIEPGSVNTALYVTLPAGATAADVETLRASDPERGPLAMPQRHAAVSQAPNDVDGGMRWGYVAEAVLFAVLGLVISMAFSIGARRQVRTLGLVAACGGSPSVVGAVVLAQGLWAGVVGALTGVALAGVVLAAGWRTFAARVFGIPDWWVVSVGDLTIIVVIGVLAAVGSAWLPARTARRLSVLQALAGRRPLPPVRPRLALGGAAVAAGGLGALALASIGTATDLRGEHRTVYSLVGLAGALAVLAGSTVGSHVVVAAAGRLGSRTRGSLRLALRSVARQRTRYGSVVAGIAATAAVALIASAIASGAVGEATANRYRTGLPANVATVYPRGLQAATPDELEARLRPVLDVVPDARVLSLGWVALKVDGVGDANPPPDWLAHVGSGAMLATDDVVEQLALTDEQRRALHAHGVIAVAPGVTPTGLHFYDQGTPGPLVDAVWFTSPTEVGSGPLATADQGEVAAILATPERLEQARVPIPPRSTTLFINPTPFTDDQLAALRALQTGNDYPFRLLRLAGHPEADYAHRSGIWVSVPSADPPDLELLIEAGISVLALLITGLVVAIGVTLAAADSRDERDTLDALGAPPRLLRRVAGVKAGALAFLGALLAIPAALLPMAVVVNTWTSPAVPRGAVVSTSTSSVTLVQGSRLATMVPWRMIAILLIALPLALALITTACSGLRARWRPVAASRFSLD